MPAADVPALKQQPPRRKDLTIYPFAPASSPLPGPRPSASVEQARTVRLLRGRDAILGQQSALTALARRSGQAGEADQLAHFLTTPDALRKGPVLLLVQGDANGLYVAGDELAGAVLLFEYLAPLALGTRVFATADSTGRRSLLAAPESRARIAALAARTLIRQGAHIVHIAFSETHTDGARPSASAPPAIHAERSIGAVLAPTPIFGTSAPHPRRPARTWFFTQQQMPVYLPLEPTFDRTLARIGQKTRANLRYYRRRAETQMGCIFVPAVSLAPQDFLAFNRLCTYAVTDATAARRLNSVAQPGFFFAGIRDRDHHWLALAGGRRQNGFVELDWQMNRHDLPAASLATVLRSFLIDHEITRGSTRLYIEGRTPQAIANSFATERVGELTVKRNSLYTATLQRFAPKVFPPKNYLGQILQRQHHPWYPW